MEADQKVDLLVRNFARFLCTSWDPALVASAAGEYDELLPDWLQSNWERLVEAALPPGIHLEVYGEGADCNAQSSRVCRPEITATNAVVCHPRSGITVPDAMGGENVTFPADGFAVDELVSIEGGWYVRRPPFDHVLVDAAPHERLFRLEDVIFDLGPANRG